MKKTLLAVLLSLYGAAAHAAADTIWGGATRVPEPATLTTIVKSSDIVVGINITTQTPTSIILDKTQMYRWVEVQNWNSTDVVCGENSQTISTPTASLSGWVVQASTGVKRFDVVPGYDFFCQSKSLSTATRVTIFRGR